MKPWKNVQVGGYQGTWSEIESIENDFGTVRLLEHDEWGDEVNYLVVDEDGKELGDTYEDLSHFLDAEGVEWER